MKVMVIVKASKDSEAGQMPSEQLLREMGDYNESLVKAGIMLAGEGLYPSSQGFRVRFSGKDRTVVNGPFAETKELIAGFWVWQVKSMEEAVEWVKRCPNPMNEDSEIEIRRVFASEDFAAIDTTGEVRAQEERLIQEMESYRLDAPRFETGKELHFAGLSRKLTAETRDQIMHLWGEFCTYLKEMNRLGDETYGVCYGGGGADGSFQYMAAVEVKNTTELPAGFAHLRVAPQRYAVFNHSKHVSEISKTFDAIYSKWLPNSGLEAVQAPAFEKYTEAFNGETGIGGIELWIPIKA